MHNGVIPGDLPGDSSEDAEYRFIAELYDLVDKVHRQQQEARRLRANPLFDDRKDVDVDR